MRILNREAMLAALAIFRREFIRLYWSKLSLKGFGSNDQLLPLAGYRLIPRLVCVKRKYIVAHGIRGAPEMPAYTEILDEPAYPVLKDVNTVEQLLSVLQLPVVLFVRELPDVSETELHSLLQDRGFIRSLAESVVDEHISRLQPTIDQQAMTMTTQYDALFKFENRLRRLIEYKLEEAHQDNWWGKGIPKRIRDKVARKVAQPRNAWHRIETESLLHECDFHDLRSIITSEPNWDTIFQPIFGAKELTNLAFQMLESNRNPIAHSNLLPDDRIVEFQGIIRRIEGLIQPHLPKDTF